MLETNIESAITQYLDRALPLDAVHFHISNEGKRGWIQQRAFKRAGGKAGIPDRCILWEGEAFFIETKRPKSGRLSAKQDEMRGLICRAGCGWAMATNVQQVEDALVLWGIPLRARIAA